MRNTASGNAVFRISHVAVPFLSRLIKNWPDSGAAVMGFIL